MNRLKLNNFNGITEFKNELKSSDIKIWIYTLPVKDLDKKHRENYDNIKFLKKEKLPRNYITEVFLCLLY